MSELSEFLKNAKGDMSIDDISARAERHGHTIKRSTVAKYLRGEHGTRVSEPIAAALAAGFDVDVREVRTLAGRTPGELKAWDPTPESASLTQDQRDALDQLIKTMVRRGGTDANTAEAGEKIDEAAQRPVSLRDAKRRRMQADAQERQRAADGRPARADHDD